MPQDLPTVDPAARERADAARNRQKVLEAAQRLFAEHGVANVSMDAIAAEAGVGKGTLFRRFGDRASLARTLVSAREAAFQEEVLRGAPPLGPGASPTERIVAFGRGILDLFDAHAEIVRAAETGHPGIRYRQSPYASYRHHLTLLVRDADPGLDADWIADALLAVLSAELFLYMRDIREMPLERIKDGFEELARRLVPAT